MEKHYNVSKSDIGFDDSSLFHKGENEMKPEWMPTEGQIQNCFTTEFIPKMGCWLPSKVVKATAQAILKWLLQDCSMHKHRNPWPRPHKECPECMSEFKQQVGKL